MEPLRKHIILKVDDEQITTKSGIIVAQDDESKQYHGVWGTVIAVGRNAEGLKTGDRVMWNKYDSVPFRYQTTEYQCLKDELVLVKSTGGQTK